MGNYDTFLQKIREQLPSSYQWEKDERFNAMLVVIENQDIEKVKNIIAGLFGSEWDKSTLGKASKPEQKAAKQLGKLQKGQIFFTKVDGNEIFFGAWWPWGDNSKVSLRTGVFQL